MKNKHPLAKLTRKISLTTLIAALIASAPGAMNAQSTCSAACQTAATYVTTFYPLWFTYYQSVKAKPNQLIGPRRVTPLYETVVAVNVDTLYASSFMQLPPSDAAILAIPSTVTVSATKQIIPSSSLSFSVLILDRYGNVLTPVNKKTGSYVASFTSGVYVFEGPGYSQSQSVPAGATELTLSAVDPATQTGTPSNVANPVIIFRVDKYSTTATTRNQQEEHAQAAEAFRDSLQMEFLSDHNLKGQQPGQVDIVSDLTYAVPFKVIADAELTIAPEEFLTQLMTAVADPNVQPLTDSEASLAEQFNQLYESGAVEADLEQGAMAAHEKIVQNYLNHRDANGWIDFNNIGDWSWIHTTNVSELESAMVDRASITEFLQFGNDFSHAVYFHSFVDANGNALDGSKSSYAIHFPAGQPPAAKRFWSITAYTPEAVELVPNELHKYHVASYTPGLQYNSDGSLTIYVGATKPAGVPEANFLPAPPREFNLMLRFYGPEPPVSNGTYVPPPVERQN